MPVRTSSHSSSEPAWPPQKADSAYGSGRSWLIRSATYTKEKSRCQSAASRTSEATAVAANAARSAFWAECASRRRRA
jgi:hypothetical protein